MRCQSVKWLTADLCRPPQTAKSLWSLSSATVGKLTKWVSSQEAQLAATWLLCRPRQTAKSSLPLVADGKEPAYCLFFLFFIKSHNLHIKYISFISHIQHISFIHSYISKFHQVAHTHCSIHTYYNAKFHQDSKFHHSKLEEYLKRMKEKTSTPS